MLLNHSKDTLKFWESSENEQGYHVTSDMMADELMEYAEETDFLRSTQFKGTSFSMFSYNQI